MAGGFQRVPLGFCGVPFPLTEALFDRLVAFGLVPVLLSFGSLGV